MLRLPPRDASELDGLYAQGIDRDSIGTYLEGQVRSLGEEIRLMETVKGYTNIVSIEDYRVISYPELPQWIVLIRMELLTPRLQHIKDAPLSESDVIKLGMVLYAMMNNGRPPFMPAGGIPDANARNAALMERTAAARRKPRGSRRSCCRKRTA